MSGFRYVEDIDHELLLIRKYLTWTDYQRIQKEPWEFSQLLFLIYWQLSLPLPFPIPFLTNGFAKKGCKYLVIFNAECKPRKRCCFTIKLSILTFATCHLTQNTLEEIYSWITFQWTLIANSCWTCIRPFSNPDIRTSLKDMTSTLDWETGNEL